MERPLMEAAVRATGLLYDPVVVLLSGGRDSVCLLDLAVRIAPRVRALHVNYGLRDEAPAEEALCRTHCERLGVELDVRSPIRPDGPGNLQSWARDQRYSAAAAVAHAHDFQVAAAHTASDQVETVLYRLAARTGRKALLGMNERDGRLVRPLLAHTRSETTRYCDEHGLEYLDDPSNATDAYARNRVRHGLLAQLATIHEGAEANVLATLQTLRDEARVLDALVDEVLTDDVEQIRGLPPALRRLVLERLAEAPVGRRSEEVLALDRGRLDLGGGVRAVVEGGRVRFEPTPTMH